MRADRLQATLRPSGAYDRVESSVDVQLAAIAMIVIHLLLSVHHGAKAIGAAGFQLDWLRPALVNVELAQQQTVMTHRCAISVARASKCSPSSLLSTGTPSQQKHALSLLFSRIYVNLNGEKTEVEPQPWTQPLFTDFVALYGDSKGPKGL